METEFQKGTYGYDASFFAGRNIETVELRDSTGKASPLIVPAYQGGVMISTVNGNEGISFSWIYYKHIESGKPGSQFNPFVGERGSGSERREVPFLFILKREQNRFFQTGWFQTR